jgi:hypothetical protein
MLRVGLYKGTLCVAGLASLCVGCWELCLSLVENDMGVGMKHKATLVSLHL